ncbi:MAG: acyltransferase [Planctomycetaceae bacterium]|nr:acyltransferase [Planctomycetaceae bacterium]
MPRQPLSVAKLLVRAGFAVLTAPLRLGYHCHSRLAGRANAFPSWSQALSLLPGRFGVYVRHAFYSGVLDDCGVDAWIGFGTIFSHPGARIGRLAYIGNYCSIGDAAIEEDVLIASHVSVMNGCHQHGIERLDIPVREQTGVYERVSIGRDSWIGERATVAANVGRHCIVGAGALVLKPVPDFAIVVGVPAKIVGDRRDHVRTVDDQPSATAAEPVEYSHY